MTRADYFKTLLELYTQHIEANDIEKENEVQKKIEDFIDATYIEGRDVEKTCRNDLKEIAHFYGGWDGLKKVIQSLEENDNEAAWERRMTDY